MSLRPSRAEAKEDNTYEKPRWIVTIGGNPVRYYATEQEAAAFVDGFEYIWTND